MNDSFMEEIREQLNEGVTKILFENNALLLLKENIDKCFAGKITKKQLKETILTHKKEILEKLMDFIPFFYSHFNQTHELAEYIKSSNEKEVPPEVKLKLAEQERVLELLGDKLEFLYNTLQEE